MVTAERLNVVVDSDGTGDVSAGLLNIRKSAISTKAAVGAMGGALAALSAGAMAKSVQVASRFQDAMIQVQKVTNPQTMREMSKEIRNMAENIPLAQTELAKITEDAARFGIRGKKALTSFTKTVSKMSVATDLSASEAGESLAKLAKLTHTPISSVDRLGSSINTLANTAATSSSEIVDSMMRASAVFAQAGLNERQIAGLSATLNEVSESSERAGTRLRRLGQEVFSATGKKAQVLGQALFGMNVPAEQAAKKFRKMRTQAPMKTLKMLAKRMQNGGKSASALNSTLTTVSRQALAGLGQNMKGLNKNLKTSESAFQKNTSLQREFAAQSKTLQNQLQLLRNRLTNIGISIGNVLLPPLTKLVKWISTGISRFSKFNSELGGMPATVALVTTAVTGLAAAIYAFGPAIAAATPALSSLALGFGAIVAPVVAVTAAFVAYRKNLFGARDAINSVASVIRGKLITTLGKLKTIWEQNLGPIRNELTELKKNIKNALMPPLRAVKGFVQKNLPLIKTIFKGVFSTISTLVTGTADALLKLGRILLNVINGDFNQAFKLAKSLVTNIIGGIGNWIKTTGKTLFITSLKLLARAGVGVFNWLKEKVTTVVKNFIGGLVSWLKGIGKEDLYNAFYAVGKNVRKAAIAFFNLGGKIGKVIKNFIGAVVSYFKSDAKTDAKNASKSMFKAVLNMGEWLKTQIIGENGIVRTMISEIVSYLKNDAWTDLKEAAKTMVGGITAAFEGLYDGLIGHSLVPDMIGDIASYLKNDAAKDLKKAAKEAAGDMANGFVNKFNKIMPDDIPLPSATIGGGSFMGKHIPEKTFGGGSINIPKLAEGGIVDSPTLAMIGEAGPEAVVPLDKKNNPAGGGTTINTLVIKSDTDNPRAHARAFERALDAETR